MVRKENDDTPSAADIFANYHHVPEYSDIIGMAFHKMKVGDVFVLSQFVKPENNNKFIKATQLLIDLQIGKSEGWEILFNEDYTKLKKIERFQP